MEKIINIGDKEVKLNNNVAWTMEYRDQFGKDIVPVIMPMVASLLEGVSTIIADTDGNIRDVASVASAIEGRATEILLPLFQAEFVDLVINVTWAMAKAADEDIDPPKKWIRQFEAFPLDEILLAVFDLTIKGFVSSKNLGRLKGIGDSLRKLQPSISTM